MNGNNSSSLCYKYRSKDYLPSLCQVKATNFKKALQVLFHSNPSALSFASLLLGEPSTCTAKYRLTEIVGVAVAYTDQTLGATSKFLQQLPLKPDNKLVLHINGAPGITVAPRASTTRDILSCSRARCSTRCITPPTRPQLTMETALPTRSSKL